MFKPKKPSEVAKEFDVTLRKILSKPDPKSSEKYITKVGQYAQQLKVFLYGDTDTEPVADALQTIANEFITQNTIPVMISCLEYLEFEARKNCTMVFNAITHRDATKDSVITHLSQHPDIIKTLLLGYDKPDLALSYGSMFRECIRPMSLAKIALYLPEFFNFFRYVQLENFEIATDAFSSFKELLTTHKPVVAEFLQVNYDAFFNAYSNLLASDNYATRRQSVKLLSDLLFDRSNYFTMMQYIGDTSNLKRIMNLLRDQSKAIQFEAFHVFKVFVMNPEKNPAIVDLLRKNKEKLTVYLTDFHKDRTEDKQFIEEKALLLAEIGKLESPKKDSQKSLEAKS